jgi:hypothetical protein
MNNVHFLTQVNPPLPSQLPPPLMQAPPSSSTSTIDFAAAIAAMAAAAASGIPPPPLTPRPMQGRNQQHQQHQHVCSKHKVKYVGLGCWVWCCLGAFWQLFDNFLTTFWQLFWLFFILIGVASCCNQYYPINFISAVPTSLLIAPGLRTIQFLFMLTQ